MKIGKKIFALLLTLAVVIGCGVLMVSAQTGPGYGEATKSASTLNCVCRISACSHVPRDNTLGVYIWATGYYVSTVGLNTATVQKYIREQEKQDQIEDSLSRKEYKSPFKGSK